MTEVTRLSPDELAERLNRPGWRVARQRIFMFDESLAVFVEQPFGVEDHEVLTIATALWGQLRLDLEDFVAYELEPGVVEVYKRERDLEGMREGAAQLRLEHPDLRTGGH
jgi:hypothetical protein